ncbi:MAG TPA: hypothetical protein VM901_06820 [Bdellovibrionota bacterium]|nr:hypothetical protein [Bdellovibrionota bacterium]
MRNIVKKAAFLSGFWSLGILALSTGARAEDIPQAQRPFASESHCFQSDEDSGTFILLEKSLEGEWLYSLMASSDKNDLHFDLYDGGNDSTLNVVGSERRFDAVNINTEAKTKLVTPLNFAKLTFSAEQDTRLADLEDDSRSIAFSKGEHKFTKVDLKICVNAL